MIDLDEDSYVACIWFVAIDEPRGSYLGTLFRPHPGASMRFHYRTRYEDDAQDARLGRSATLVALGPAEDIAAMERALDDSIGLVAAELGAPLQKLKVHGGIHRLAELSETVPWMHARSTAEVKA
jgi:hypothetical protein